MDINANSNFRSTFVEMSSPERMQNLKPKLLTYGSPEHETYCIRKSYLPSKLITSPQKQHPCSPPYRKVRALRLFDTPTTPKTIIQKSAFAKHNQNSMIENDSSVFPSSIYKTRSLPIDRPTVIPIHNKNLDVYPTANVNPFSPNSLSLQTKKRSRTLAHGERDHNNSMHDISLKNNNRCSVASLFSDFSDINSSSCSEDESSEIVQAPKRLALQDSNISRYAKEFIEISSIGIGQFGLVYKCLNRLDGCVYAIKKSIKPVAGSVLEKTALNEVWAHAVLGKHDNVVRYFSAWAEDNHMVIQNEYCNGGNLQTLLQERLLKKSELRTLLMHIAAGLKYIHSNDLVHMDLKAGNIFMNKVPARSAQIDSGDDGFEDTHDDLEIDDIVTYKIGDLGHVTSTNDPQVEEGDCRYLPNEILQEDFSQLCKADIFSLGITIFEAGGGGPLPKNGAEWHALRNGNIPDLPNISREFNDLIKSMAHPNPLLRPSSAAIFNHPIFCSSEIRSKLQLTQDLLVERQKNEILSKKLKETTLLLKSYELAHTPTGKRGKHSPIASDRKLRSFTKKSQRSLDLRRRTSFRDQNKYVNGDVDYYR